MYVQVDADGADAGPVLSALPGVSRVAVSEQRGTLAGFEVESELIDKASSVTMTSIIKPMIRLVPLW